MYPCEYFINTEKGVVVCKLHDTEEALLNDMVRNNVAPAHEDAYINTLIAETFIGKAVCKPEDTFDAEKGKLIAYKKAIKKLNLAKKRALARVVEASYNSYQYVSTLATKLGPKYDNVIKSCDEHIQRVAGGAAPNSVKEGEK